MKERKKPITNKYQNKKRKAADITDTAYNPAYSDSTDDVIVVVENARLLEKAQEAVLIKANNGAVSMKQEAFLTLREGTWLDGAIVDNLF